MMNIYCEFKKQKIRIKINGDEIAVQLREDFYPRKMFKDATTNKMLEGFVYFHKKKLGLIERIRHRFEKNRVLILINQEVQGLVTIRQIYNYATLFFEGKSVYIIRKRSDFDSERLEAIEKITDEYINSRYHDDTVISNLTEEHKIQPAETPGAVNKLPEARRTSGKISEEPSQE